ncbi:hypothetical protein BN2497_14155 [Janthinobacterium sp. CG23_2]|nr:hypothetical protein BN2497_14155 [Janthinobacterium sp. CG23_2]CUU33475.1 hypothetical protein BN3177_14155 [Janthinobacterium sp. CG23_2]
MRVSANASRSSNEQRALCASRRHWRIRRRARRRAPRAGAPHAAGAAGMRAPAASRSA